MSELHLIDGSPVGIRRGEVFGGSVPCEVSAVPGLRLEEQVSEPGAHRVIDTRVAKRPPEGHSLPRYTLDSLGPGLVHRFLPWTQGHPPVLEVEPVLDRIQSHIHGAPGADSPLGNDPQPDALMQPELEQPPRVHAFGNPVQQESKVGLTDTFEVGSRSVGIATFAILQIFVIRHLTIIAGCSGRSQE